MELKELSRYYNLNNNDIYKFMGVTRQSVDHIKKNNKIKYNQFINDFILRYNNIDTMELIKIIELYKIQSIKIQ